MLIGDFLAGELANVIQALLQENVRKSGLQEFFSEITMLKTQKKVVA
jgi:hypothetical protein